MGQASSLLRTASPRLFAPLSKGSCKIPLPDMVFFIRRCEHFTFVDHVGAHDLKYLCFVGMANSTFSHDWDCYCVHYLLNYLNTCSPCYSACLPNIVWQLVKDHNCYSA